MTQFFWKNEDFWQFLLKIAQNQHFWQKNGSYLVKIWIFILNQQNLPKYIFWQNFKSIGAFLVQKGCFSPIFGPISLFWAYIIIYWYLLPPVWTSIKKIGPIDFFTFFSFWKPRSSTLRKCINWTCLFLTNIKVLLGGGCYNVWRIQLQLQCMKYSTPATMHEVFNTSYKEWRIQLQL